MLSIFKTAPILARHRALKQKKQISWVKRILLVLLVLFIVGIIALGSFLFWLTKDLPKISNIDEIVFAQSSTIYDRNGIELYTLYGNENRKLVTIEQIPATVINSTQAIEDADFFNHSGFSFKGYIRAFLSEIVHLGAHKSGGSTITQQFIKNTFLTTEKTYTRKLKELILAIQLEQNYSKDEILAMYLNSIPYGNNAFGVGQASLTFFGKEISQVSLAESCILAALPKAPSYYSPYGSHVHSSVNIPETELKNLEITSYHEFLPTVGETAIVMGLLPTKLVLNNGSEIIIPGRTSNVLDRMLELGLINEKERNDTENILINYQFKTYRTEIKAPHFVMYVRDLLEEKYGKEFVLAGGLKIYTSLDYNLQQEAEKIVLEQILKNEKKYEAKNASLISVNPKTGEILAMVGSRDYWDEENDGKVNVNLQRRLPGSSFKPFVYAAAFSAGYAPATVLFDLETDFGNGYKPKNFSGKFIGPITIRKALGNSLNIPAVKAGILAGQQRVYDLAKGMGITFPKPAEWYGSAIALGVAEIRPIDMVQAYAVFANSGKKVPLNPFLKIVDRHGNILQALGKPMETVVLDEETAYLISDVLSDPNARGIGWNAMLQLPNRKNAIKTGTSNKRVNNKVLPLDAWTVGYTPDLVTCVWAGNNDGSAMNYLGDGYSAAAPIWRNFMILALKDQENKDFTRPAGIKSVVVSSLTGRLPSAKFPSALITKDIFSTLNMPTTYDNSLKIMTVEKTSGKLPNEFTPEGAKKEIAVLTWSSEKPDDPNWENPVRKWMQNHADDYLKKIGVDEVLTKVPSEIENIHNQVNTSNKPSITITSPAPFGEVSKSSVGVWVEIKSDYGIALVEFFLNDQLVDSQQNVPYKGNIIFPPGTKIGDNFSITAKVYDTLYNSNSSTIKVKVAKDEQAPVTEIVFPSDEQIFSGGSIITVQTYTYDAKSDINKVEFFLNEAKVNTVRESPYNSQIQLPAVVGDCNIKVVAYDKASNSAEDEIKITIKETENASDLKVMVNNSIKYGNSEQITFYVPVSNLNDIAKVELVAQSNDNKNQVLTIITDLSSESSGVFNYLWVRPELGEYKVFVKTTYKNGKVLFSFKNKVSVIE